MNRKVSWISKARFAPFLAECSENEDLAWQLYEWNAKVASALSECFHHAEVLLRNAMMYQLEKIHPLAYPWQTELGSVTNAAQRRKDASTGAAQPDSIVSELTLGFWSHLLEPGQANEELWRHHLRFAFPGSPGTRASVHKAVSDMRHLRNRCAHQDSLLDFDPEIELKKMLSLAEWIDPEAREWIEDIEAVNAVARERPVAPDRNVVIVAARMEDAVQMYEKVSAYVCPSDRSFATVRYLGFYCDKKIQPYFPAIEKIVVPTRWSKDESKRLSASSDITDQRVAKVMGYGLKNGWPSGEQFQVFLLTPKGSDDTLKRATPIIHSKSGRGSAFVQFKRYFSHPSLMAADDTAHLP